MRLARLRRSWVASPIGPRVTRSGFRGFALDLGSAAFMYDRLAYIAPGSVSEYSVHRSLKTCHDICFQLGSSIHRCSRIREPVIPQKLHDRLAYTHTYCICGPAGPVGPQSLGAQCVYIFWCAPSAAHSPARSFVALPLAWPSVPTAAVREHLL